MKLEIKLSLTPKIVARLERIRGLVRAGNLSEVFRRALAVFELLVDEREAGGRILIERPGGATVEVSLDPEAPRPMKAIE